MVDSLSARRTATVVFVGSAGIAIAVTEAFGGVPSLGPVGSTIALTVLAAPLAYASYRVALSKSTATGTRTNDAAKMDAEEVKQRTERWSEEAAINPAFPPGQGPDQQSSSLGQDGPRSSITDPESNRTENPNREANRHSSSVDPSDLEFAWQTETDVSFDDLGGMDELKDKLRTEVIQPIENPEEAEKLGVTAPNVLFTGPPGTGKSYSAKALATELGLPFVSLSGADIQSKWINESASMVNNLFCEAEEIADREGGAVVFLDELDSVLKSRSGDGSSHEEDNKVVNEFLTNLEDLSRNVCFLAATNRPEALDEAGVRSGRIDLKLHVGKPDAETREAILHTQLADREHELSDEFIADLAAATDGAVAADLEQLVNRAAKNVLTRGGDTIYRSDFD